MNPVFKHKSELEIVEAYAWENNGIASEEQLSEMFDRDVAPSVHKQYGKDDLPAIMETFNNWSDLLCKQGYLHPEQYNQYCYVGMYSDKE